jgi:two-component system response regulator HupR/HoxA
VVALRTPPLRERGEDLDILIDHFMARLAARLGRTKRLAPATRGLLKAHRWPGNVRELQNEIERVWVLSGDDPLIHPEHLSRNVAQGYLQRGQAKDAQPPGAVAAASPEPVLDEEPLYRVVERAERQTIERVLGKVGGNRTRAAQTLGISRRNLIRKLEQLGLSAADDGAD